MELLQYTFFRYALLASLLAAVACGIVGSYVVTRRLVFVGGGITHSSFGGVGIAMFFGFSPVAGAALFALLAAVGVQWLGTRRNVRSDSAIAVVWTLGMAVGVIFSYLTPGYRSELSTYLFGNILTVSPADLWLLAAVSLLLILFFALFYHPVLFIAFDREFARSRQLPVAAIEYALMALTALTVVACLRLVGIVLVLSLLTVPQMTANLFTDNFRRMIWGSILLAFATCVGGLFASYWLNVPSGATIILLSAGVYALCKAIKSLLALRAIQ